MDRDFEILAGLYNAFDPFRPLPAGDPAYVDLKEVRGDGDILVELGKNIILSDKVTCQLYAGHRGAGKSTELLRLEKHLTGKGYRIIYFAADEEDISPENTEYTDILLACTRHLLQQLKDVDPNPVLRWFKERWRSLNEFMQTEIHIDSLDAEAQIVEFAKLTATLKASPSTRQKIREQVESHTVTLIDGLNSFISEFVSKYSDSKNRLVVIADNLDRIVPISDKDGRNNHDQIFIDRSEQLKALNCHIIYTVPVSMIYSNQAIHLQELYGPIEVLPMIMVKTPDDASHQPGVDKLKQLIESRIRKVDPKLTFEQVFDGAETLEKLCLMSGGHVRNLTLLMKASLIHTEGLPISARAVQRAVTELRVTYRNAIDKDEWSKLASISRSKEIVNDTEHRRLLLNHCILEYRYFDESGEMRCWHDIHPVISGIEEFQQTLNLEKST